MRERLARELGVEASDLVLRRTGLYADVYAAGELIVKCARDTAAGARLLREADILRQLPADLPVAVPRPVLVNADPAFFVVPRLDGRVYRSAAVAAWPAARRRRFTDPLGVFLAALHAAPLTLPPLSLAGRTLPVPGGATAPPRRLKRHFERWRREAKLAGIELSGPLVPIHNDLNTTNLLIGPDGTLNAVLDFDAARMAPAVLDFRKFWTKGTRFRDEVIDAYVAAGGVRPVAVDLARAEAAMLMKLVRQARGGDAAAARRLNVHARRRLQLERAMRWRRFWPFDAGAPVGPAKPAAPPAE